MIMTKGILKEFVDTINLNGTNSADTRLTNLIILVLSRRIDSLNVDLCWEYFILQSLFDTPGIDKNLFGFVKDADEACLMLNKIGRQDLWEKWLQYHLSDTIKEVTFVKGCMRLATILNKDMSNDDTATVLQALDDFCKTSDIMQEIFGD